MRFAIHAVHWFSMLIQAFALVQRYELVDGAEPLHQWTGSPYVRLSNDDSVGPNSSAFCVVPIAEIVQRVHVIADKRPDCLENAWINWWVTFGPCAYPSGHRWLMQERWQWRPLLRARSKLLVGVRT
jgi:hypothetical protein